jgi:hypothetical protein
VVIPAVEAGLQCVTLVMQPADRQITKLSDFRKKFTRRGGLQPKEVYRTEFQSAISDPKSDFRLQTSNIRYGSLTTEITETTKEEPKLDATSFHLCALWRKSVQNRQSQIPPSRRRVWTN